jgi:ATP-dependent DNA helicase PIF1
MELSIEQQLAFDKYIQGHNIFITGPGGTGKSALIRQINGHAIEHGKNIKVCALTGCASILLNCNAKTLHSWAGIGLGNGTIEELVLKIKKNKFTRAMWMSTDILVVDEISMLSLKLFNLLNEIGKVVRKNTNYFGGIQLIFSGDFYQLPPVGDKDEIDTTRFCFESNDWNSIFTPNNQIQLVKIFRQTDDNYTSILNQIREGKLKKKSNELLLTYVGREYDSNLVAMPTKLFPTRNKVENINNIKMSELESESKEYNIKCMAELKYNTRIQFSETEIKMESEFLINNLICDKKIILKNGSQVMCVVNIQTDAGTLEICNGSQGIVTGFCKDTGYPIVKYNNGIQRVMTRHTWVSEKIEGLSITQVPLILAWALTIHKSQGSTMDAAEIDIGAGIFECGQTYVALSRVKSLDGLYLTSFDASKIKINKKVKLFYHELNEIKNNIL